MTPPDFKKALEGAAQQLRRQELSREADARLQRRLFEGDAAPPRPARWRPVAAFAAVAAAVIAVVAVRALGPRAEQLGGFAVVQRSEPMNASVSGAGVLSVELGEVTLKDALAGMTFQVRAPAQVAREGDGVRVLRGWAAFSVEKRAHDAVPARVLVSGGVIEVFGTRFTVEESGEKGSVTLHEGSIGFRPLRGERVMLAPGATLAWPLPEPQAADEPEPPPPEPEKPRPQRRPLTVKEEALETDALVREVAALRTRGRYAEAVGVLERALSAPCRPRRRRRSRARG